MTKRSTASGYRHASASENESALKAKRGTDVQRLRRVVGEIERHLRCGGSPSDKKFQSLSREYKKVRDNCIPTALRDKGIQCALKGIVRQLRKRERAFRDYGRVTLLSQADLFAQIVKARTTDKCMLNPIDMRFAGDLREAQGSLSWKA